MLMDNNSNSAVLQRFTNLDATFAEIDYVTMPTVEGKWECLLRSLLGELMARRANRRGPGRPAKGVGSASFGATEDAIALVRQAYTDANGPIKHKDVAKNLGISLTLLWRIRKMADL